ncbi:MAG: DUF1648 domain-containing protein [Pseudonocardiaceae bacterium]|nr:DUF1648 domain-containing protein [Pseudonocardiaceae bacterium]
MSTGLLVIYAASIALIGVIAVLLPNFSRPTLAFGVRIPPEQVDSEFVTEQRRWYQRWVLAGCAALLAVQLPLALAVPEFVQYGLSTLPVVVVAGAVYYRAHSRIRAAKRQQGWYDSARQGIAVDTSLRSDPERFPWLWVLPAIVVLAITAVIGILRYPSMPDILVLHWSGSGEPDRTAPKSPGSAFVLVFVQAGLTAFLVVLTRLCFGAKPELDPARPRGSARQHRRFSTRTAKAMLVLTAASGFTMLGAALMVWWNSFSVPLLLLSLLPVAIGVVGLLVLSVRTGQGGSKLEQEADVAENTGYVEQDDDRFWLAAGLFYVNRDDPAVFVQKRVGFGWTVNLANPKAWLLFVGLIGIAVLPALLLP